MGLKGPKQLSNWFLFGTGTYFWTVFVIQTASPKIHAVFIPHPFSVFFQFDFVSPS